MNSYQREVNNKFDARPAIGHYFNASLIKKYVKKGKVLDIGCWTGLLYRALKSKKHSYTGIDIEKSAIETAKKKNKSARFKVGSAIEIPYTSNTFDAVAYFDVIEHIPEGTEPKSIKEISRVLKKDGVLLLGTPAKNILSILSDPAYFLIGHRHYSMNELKELLSKEYEILDAFTAGGIFFVSKYMLELFYKHVFRKSVPESQVIKSIEKLGKAELENHRGFLTNYIIAQKIK